MKQDKHFTDRQLITAAKAGDKRSLDQLIRKHQNWIYNVALSFVADTDHAADVAQEALIKIITHLGSFKHESDFKTWAFRIVKNHFLNMTRRKYEQSTTSFECFANGLDSIADEDPEVLHYKIEREKLIEEAKISCLRAMLLCLTREQRLIYILADIFEFTDKAGAEIMEISRGNFRVKLHRARTELYNFINAKCGLINKNNPCRCAKKTSGFIRLGFVDPVNLKFQAGIIEQVAEALPAKIDSLNGTIVPRYRKLFQQLPQLQAPTKIDLVKKFIASDSFVKTFNLW